MVRYLLTKYHFLWQRNWMRQITSLKFNILEDFLLCSLLGVWETGWSVVLFPMWTPWGSERQGRVLCSQAKHPGGLRDRVECCVPELNTLGVLRDRVECCVPELNTLGVLRDRVECCVPQLNSQRVWETGWSVVLFPSWSLWGLRDRVECCMPQLNTLEVWETGWSVVFLS